MQQFTVTRFMKLSITAMALILFTHVPVAQATTVLDMPAPPKIQRTQPAPNVEADAKTTAETSTWLDRAREADISGDERSYLGVIAISRYAKYRSSPRYSYYSNPHRRSYYGGWNSHYGHYPFDVSFLHGVPINCGIPSFNFHWNSSKRFCW